MGIFIFYFDLLHADFGKKENGSGVFEFDFVFFSTGGFGKFNHDKRGEISIVTQAKVESSFVLRTEQKNMCVYALFVFQS